MFRPLTKDIRVPVVLTAVGLLSALMLAACSSAAPAAPAATSAPAAKTAAQAPAATSAPTAPAATSASAAPAAAAQPTLAPAVTVRSPHRRQAEQEVQNSLRGPE